jgi:predicted metal-dependent phosphoesterase TrpH
MSTIYDLHCHSTASDGVLTPEEVVMRAASNGVGVLALTDHDDTSGLVKASEMARKTGLEFINGIELSVSWSHQTIHIVGLHIKPETQTLQSGLEVLRQIRTIRGEEIAQRLEKKGISGALEGASKFAAGNILSRTHFARFLLQQGHAKDMRQVFKRFLVSGKPGYVPGKWASLEEALQWISDANGMAIIAHPARYRLSATRMRQLMGEFKELGGVAIEVVSGCHSKDDINNMAVMANRFEFAASAGSDFHSPDNQYTDLGRISSIPQKCKPIWQLDRWKELVSPTQSSG